MEEQVLEKLQRTIDYGGQIFEHLTFLYTSLSTGSVKLKNTETC